MIQLVFPDRTLVQASCTVELDNAVARWCDEHRVNKDGAEIQDWAARGTPFVEPSVALAQGGAWQLSWRRYRVVREPYLQLGFWGTDILRSGGRVEGSGGAGDRAALEARIAALDGDGLLPHLYLLALLRLLRAPGARDDRAGEVSALRDYLAPEPGARWKRERVGRVWELLSNAERGLLEDYLGLNGPNPLERDRWASRLARYLEREDPESLGKYWAGYVRDPVPDREGYQSLLPALWCGRSEDAGYGQAAWAHLLRRYRDDHPANSLLDPLIRAIERGDPAALDELLPR